MEKDFKEWMHTGGSERATLLLEKETVNKLIAAGTAMVTSFLAHCSKSQHKNTLLT